MDKSIVEAIGDPLTHLIRNAIDHGIESPQERETKGKPAAGTVVLRAFHQAGKVNATIEDDGAASLHGSNDLAPQDCRIVLAEDSDFFRVQLVRYLSQAGFEVIDFEDGEKAWQFLRKQGDTVDVVVTDIEMPKMDGCELAGRIKADPALQHLPIIAVTSLSGEEDRRRGLEAGIDEYQIKLDRERVMACVARFALNSQRRATDC